LRSFFQKATVLLLLKLTAKLKNQIIGLGFWRIFCSLTTI